MKQNDILIKWTGSKRRLASDIICWFPKDITTYYEPFLGGGSVLYVLLSSKIKVQRYICSDANNTLMEIWGLVKDNPAALWEYYVRYWPCDRNTYNDIRSQFNQDKDPRKLYFLLRTCRNGNVRFNSRGEFNVAFHERRRGMTPERLRATIYDWHQKLQRVELLTADFSGILSEPGDFLYLDPPYQTKNAFYSIAMDYNRLWDWMRSQGGNYVLSMSGIDVPNDLYEDYRALAYGKNPLNRPEGSVSMDGVYLRRRSGLQRDQ